MTAVLWANDNYMYSHGILFWICYFELYVLLCHWRGLFSHFFINATPFMNVLSISWNITFAQFVWSRMDKNIDNKWNTRIVRDHSVIVFVISLTFSAFSIWRTLINLIHSDVLLGSERKLICGLGVKIAVFLDIWLWASRTYMSLFLLHCPFTHFNFYRIS